MRCRLAFGVLALVFLALVDALDFQRRNVFGHRLVHLTLDPDKGLVLVFQALVQLGQRHVQQFGQLAQERLVTLHILRNGPDAGRRNAGSQDQAIAVQHPAPVGGQRQRAGKAHFALTLEKVIGNHLDVHRARGQAQKSQGNRGHDQLAAPDRGAAGQQRAGGVGDAAAHGARLAATGNTPGFPPM